MVYVISQDSKPLMPCSNPIARLLLKQGKAKVKEKCPFTIKLNYETTEYTQELTLGVDTGSSHVGVAVSDNIGKIYYISDVEIRNDISDKMTQRSKYRRTFDCRCSRIKSGYSEYKRNHDREFRW